MSEWDAAAQALADETAEAVRRTQNVAEWRGVWLPEPDDGGDGGDDWDEPDEPEPVVMRFRGDIAEFMRDRTRLIDVEGAFRSGKTTAALWKVFQSTQEHPGINWLICRYSDGDTQSKLKPPWRAVLAATNARYKWDPTELCDVFDNESRVYIFGLKSPDQQSRYGKLRGMTLAGVYVDQTEELPKDIFQELIGRLSQPGYPQQMILTPNPPDENHWLCEEFPETNVKPGRRYYGVPIYANAHNLHADVIAGLEEAYPPSHPKHRSAILGKRGLNVIGEPCYKGAFVRQIHVRDIEYSPHLPLDEAIDFGKHHPCVVWRQTSPFGQVVYLGGLLGQNLYLEDFVPLLLHYRQQWFPNALEVRTCCDPAGATDNSQGVRKNGVQVLKDFGLTPRWHKNSNAPDVRLAMIERHAGLMRKRTPNGEALGVAARTDRWLRLVSDESVVEHGFIADAFEAGYVWDQHMVSVGSKQIRKAKKDGWYEHGMNCAEYLELNFGAVPRPRETARGRWWTPFVGGRDDGWMA